MTVRRPALVLNVGIAFLLALAALAWRPAHAADPREGGPLALLISYHTPPANRVAFRQAMEQSEVPQLERWRAEGVLKSVHVVFNRHVDSPNWDAMALITFARYSDVERWKEIEKTSPAGLSPRALALTSAIETVPGDLMRAGGKDSRPGVFLVIPYEYLVPVNDYLAYLDGYTVPQMEGWIEEGVLARYSVFLSRYPAGRPWQAMLILEYKGDEALGAREATTAKVRTRLKDNPKWKAISDSKKNVRNEKPPVVADEILAR